MEALSLEQQQAVAALNVVMPLLAKHDLRWVITTGFACYVHGVARPITDIDIDVDAASDDPRFTKLIADLAEYITQPLKHYVDARYDNMNFEATVNGQLIDICTMADMNIFDRSANAYVPFYDKGFPDLELKQFCGLTLPIMSKDLVIYNKRMLLEDLAMEPEYRSIHERDIAGLEANLDLAACAPSRSNINKSRHSRESGNPAVG